MSSSLLAAGLGFTCLLAGLFSGAQAATPAEWRSRSIYQVVTDRFARADGSTTATCNVNDGLYCGGSWQGIINKLDYIQDMGFSAIWISPIVENIEDDTGFGFAYHGYWQKNINALNSHFGTADDLNALAAALHDRGMFLMVDIVVNHFAFSGNHANVDYSQYSPFNSQSDFHNFCFISNFDNQTDVEQCWLGDDTVPLPDVNTDLSSVQTTYQNWVKNLVTTYNIDGFRVDTVKHVQMNFWRPFNDAGGVYMVGEVLDGDPTYTCPYQDVMDGVLNYLTYFPLTRAFQSTSGSISDLASMVEQVKDECADSTLLGSFTENQDNPRFASLTSDVALSKNIIAFNILGDGIPIIYYGEEQGFSGGNDPNNREAMWFSDYSTTATRYTHIQVINQIRNQAIFNSGDNYLTYKAFVIEQDSNTLTLRKGLDGEAIIAVFTNMGSNGGSKTISVSDTGYTSGSLVTEVISCQQTTVGSGGTLSVTLSGGLPRVYYPNAKLTGSGICGL